MKHEEMQVLVSAYHDGEVTAEEKALVEAHLAECVLCAEALASYRRLGRSVQALPRGVASRTLWPRIREGLASPVRRPLWLRLAPLASAAALLVVGISLVVALRVGLSLPSAGFMAVEEDSGGTPALAVPVVPPSATEAVLGVQGLPGYEGGGVTPGTPRDEANKAALAACAGQPLAVELVNLSVRSDARRDIPRVQGVLYNAQGQPMAGVVLVISGTAGWTGSVSTGADGSFALDLPAAGAYQVVLALVPAIAPAAQVESTVDTVQGRVPAGEPYEVALPDGQICLSPGSTPAPVPFTLATGEEAILTLRSR